MERTTWYRTQAGLWLTLVALVAALIAGPAGMALAQGSDEVNCNGLSEPDCALLRGAHEAMQSFESVALPAFDLQARFSAEGEALDAHLAGEGMIRLAPALAALRAMLPEQEMGFAGMSAMLDVIEAIDAAMVESALNESAGHLRITTARLALPDDTQTATLEAVLKDGGLYVYLEAPNGAEAWFGQEIALTSSDLTELRDGLDELRAQLESEEFMGAVAEMSEYQSRFDALNDLVNQHITTTRGDDAELHGQAMATFTTALDVKGLLADPEVAPTLFDLLSSPMFAESGEFEDLNPAQIQLGLVAVAMVVTESSITMQQWVGLDDGAPHRIVGEIALVLDTALFASDGDTPTEPVEIRLSMDIELDDLNAVNVAALAVPEDYYPLDQIEQFSPGTPDRIDGTLALGESVEGSLVTDQIDLYTVEVSGAPEVEIVLEADDYVTLFLYGPDGFLIDSIDDYYGGTLTMTWDVDGVYMITVEGDYVDYALSLNVP